MCYSDYVGIFALETDFKLVKKHYVKANHVKIFSDFLFIVTDDAIYTTIITMQDAQLYEIANTNITMTDPRAMKELTLEEEKVKSDDGLQIAIRPPLALKILALCQNKLVLQLYNGDLKCMTIKNDMIKFAFMLKSAETEQDLAIDYYNENTDIQTELYLFIKWAGLDSKLLSEPEAVQQDKSALQ